MGLLSSLCAVFAFLQATAHKMQGTRAQDYRNETPNTRRRTQDNTEGSAFSPPAGRLRWLDLTSAANEALTGRRDKEAARVGKF